MRILLLTHSFNSLSQRLHVELRARGHVVSVELDIADSVAEEAVALFRPEVIVAPFLKRAVPEAIWARHLCLIVHPGIVGDRGPSALDWAIQAGATEWGVTVLQANAEMDAGDVWATATFPLPAGAKKSSIYRNQVTEAATAAVLAALARVADRRAGVWRPVPLSTALHTRRAPGLDGERALTSVGSRRPLMRQADRAIDWHADDTATVLRKLQAADGFPGVADALLGVPCHLFDARAASQAEIEAAHAGAGGVAGAPASMRLCGEASGVLARRGDALLRATRDGAVWIGHVTRRDAAADAFAGLKLPATLAFADRLDAVPELAGPSADSTTESTDGWPDIRYREAGAVGFLSFDFYNGAMSTDRCERLLTAYATACARPTRVIVLLGGADFWSNGIHLHVIEAADSPADESWRNINAMDDLCRALLETRAQLTIAALRGNAGAGGCFLALAADRVWAREGSVLNPHYKNMGNLYGSEYWTYLLPRRVGAERAGAIMQDRLPLGAAQAAAMGLVDEALPGDLAAFEAAVAERAQALAAHADFPAWLEAKRRRRAADEAQKPLAAYREEELARMRRNFYGFDPSYHVARSHFVRKSPHSWTPRHLAIHREPGWTAPVAAPSAAAGGR